jgi:transcriptional regulator with XRE-family HTH domain
MKTFAERLKLLRKQKTLTQVKMSEFLGCTVQHYQRIEYGKINLPTLDLITLADLFDVSLDYLVGRSDVPERR